MYRACGEAGAVPPGTWSSLMCVCLSGLTGAVGARLVCRPGHHVVDEAVLEGLGRGEPAVAVGVLGDALEGLSGVLGDQLRHLALELAHRLRTDRDVRFRAAEAAGGLVHHDLRV